LHNHLEKLNIGTLFDKTTSSQPKRNLMEVFTYEVDNKQEVLSDPADHKDSREQRDIKTDSEPESDEQESASNQVSARMYYCFNAW